VKISNDVTGSGQHAISEFLTPPGLITRAAEVLVSRTIHFFHFACTFDGMS